jgi:hypothetical protein
MTQWGAPGTARLASVVVMLWTRAAAAGFAGGGTKPSNIRVTCLDDGGAKFGLLNILPVLEVKPGGVELRLSCLSGPGAGPARTLMLWEKSIAQRTPRVERRSETMLGECVKQAKMVFGMEGACRGGERKAAFLEFREWRTSSFYISSGIGMSSGKHALSESNRAVGKLHMRAFGR